MFLRNGYPHATHFDTSLHIVMPGFRFRELLALTEQNCTLLESFALIDTALDLHVVSRSCIRRVSYRLGLSEAPRAPTDCVGPAATAYGRPHAPRQPNHGIPPIFANTAFS